VALREICKYQKSTNLLLSKLPFERLVQEIADEVKPNIPGSSPDAVCWGKNSIIAIQETAEHFLVCLLEGIILY